MDKLKTWLFQELELDIHLPFLKAGTFCFGVRQFHIPDAGKHGWRRLPLTHDSKWRFFIHLLLFSWFHSSQCQTRACLCFKSTWIPSGRNPALFCSLQGLPIWHPHSKAHQEGRQELQGGPSLVRFVQLSGLNTCWYLSVPDCGLCICSRSPELTRVLAQALLTGARNHSYVLFTK